MLTKDVKKAIETATVEQAEKWNETDEKTVFLCDEFDLRVTDELDLSHKDGIAQDELENKLESLLVPTLNKAYSIGRIDFKREGKVTAPAVSVELERLIRESKGVSILEVLDAYTKGNRDESLVQSDAELVKSGSFTVEELADFPSAIARKENEEEFNYVA